MSRLPGEQLVCQLLLRMWLQLRGATAWLSLCIIVFRKSLLIIWSRLIISVIWKLAIYLSLLSIYLLGRLAASALRIGRSTFTQIRSVIIFHFKACRVHLCLSFIFCSAVSFLLPCQFCALLAEISFSISFWRKDSRYLKCIFIYSI